MTDGLSRDRSARLVRDACAALLALAVLSAGRAAAADLSREGLTVTGPKPTAPPPVPSLPLPYGVGPPLTPADLSIVDGHTRFLTGGAAQARCPGEAVLFVPGVLNPFRPTLPSDGAFMCRQDAIAEGFVGE